MAKACPWALNTMKRALITGITGQDGSYLAELLLNKGYEVHGLIRRSSSFNTERLDHLYADPHEDSRLHLHYGDLTDGVGVRQVLTKAQPDEVYNLGAQSHVRVSFDCPVYTVQTDAIGTINLLEAIRDTGRPIRFYQASSSEMYGKVAEPLNLGSGKEIRIKTLAEMIAGLPGYQGKIQWNTSKPDGQPRRCLDVNRAKEEIGFESHTGLVEGLDKTIEWFKSQEAA